MSGLAGIDSGSFFVILLSQSAMAFSNDTFLVSPADNITDDLRIGVIYEQPYTTPCALKPECPSRGYGMDAAIYVCQVMRLNCTFEWYHSQDYGLQDDGGNWTGLLNAISVGRYDTSLPIFTPNPTRYRIIGFTEPYFHPDVFLITRMPDGVIENSQLSRISVTLLDSFDWPVWFSFLISFAAIAVLIVTPRLAKVFGAGRPPGPSTLASAVSSAVSVMLKLMGGQKLRPGSLSSRVAVVLWGLLTLVLTSAYTSFMFSETVVTRNNLPFTNVWNFISCIERHRCRLIDATISHSTVQHFITEASYADRFRAALKKNPIEIVPDDQIAARILNERRVYLTTVAPTPKFVQITNDNLGCRFYAVKTKLKELYGFPVRKDSAKTRKCLDKMAALFRDVGMTAALESRYGLNDNACPNDMFIYTPTKENSVKLSSLISIFSIYAVGIIIASAGFVAELLSCMYSRMEGARSEFYVDYKLH